MNFLNLFFYSFLLAYKFSGILELNKSYVALTPIVIYIQEGETLVLTHPAICWIHYVQIALSISKHLSLSQESEPSISAEHPSRASQPGTSTDHLSNAKKDLILHLMKMDIFLGSY